MTSEQKDAARRNKIIQYRNALTQAAAAVCKEAERLANKRFFERYGYNPKWPRGSVEDRKVWIKDFHHAKRLITRAAKI